MIKSYLLVFILVIYCYVANYPNLVTESNKHFIMLLDFVGQKFKQGTDSKCGLSLFHNVWGFSYEDSDGLNG